MSSSSKGFSRINFMWLFELLVSLELPYPRLQVSINLTVDKLWLYSVIFNKSTNICGLIYGRIICICHVHVSVCPSSKDNIPPPTYVANNHKSCLLVLSHQLCMFITCTFLWGLAFCLCDNVTKPPVTFRWTTPSESPWCVCLQRLEGYTDRYDHVSAPCVTRCCGCKKDVCDNAWDLYGFLPVNRFPGLRSLVAESDCVIYSLKRDPGRLITTIRSWSNGEWPGKYAM